MTVTESRLIDNHIFSRIAATDPTVWGPNTREEASKRLGWVNLHQTSAHLPEQIARLRDELGDVTRIILAGMGGSSLAPEVMSHTYGKDLLICDSTHPDHIAPLAQDLTHTLVIIASKSGSTVETDSARRYFWECFTRAGIDPATRFVAITDPGSPLEARAEEEGWRAIFLADPTVGGRYSALSAFGLVPAGLVGVDITRVLADAAQIAPMLGTDSTDNPALTLAARIGEAHQSGIEKVAIDPLDENFSLVGVWIEQLIAESTGKDGIGFLPIAPQDTPATTVHVGAGTHASTDTTVSAPLGAQFLLWEYVTAAASYLIGVNAFDQPNVESAKAAMRELLAAGSATLATQSDTSFTDGDIEVSGPDDLLEGHSSIAEVVSGLRSHVPTDGYVGIQAFVARPLHTDLVRLRPALAKCVGVATTFGFGPRYLHSTGQYHKGGHPNGGFIQITDVPTQDFAVPGTEFTFGQLIAAQSRGDANVLLAAGRPVVRFHVTNPSGFEQLLAL